MRKTKYNPDTFPELAEMYARDGLIDAEIAKKLGISKETFYTYQNKYVDFFDSIKRGKEPVDFRVEQALLKRALGYEYTEKATEDGKDGVKTRETTRMVVEDVTAIKFWLKNRRPDRWREIQEVMSTITGDLEITVEPEKETEL